MTRRIAASLTLLLAILLGGVTMAAPASAQYCNGCGEGSPYPLWYVKGCYQKIGIYADGRDAWRRICI